MAIVEKITQEDLILYEIIKHPVLFGEFYRNIDKTSWEEEFNYTDYQIDILCDFNNYVCLCAGRAVGKCVHKDSMVLNPDTGEYKSVKDWYNVGLSSILAIDQDSWKQNKAVPEIEPNGIKDCLEIITSKGYKTIVTPEHPILTNKGFVSADKLSIGDYISAAYSIPYFGNEDMEDYKILAAAHFIAEGCYHSGAITTTDKEVIDEIYYIAEKFDCKVTQTDYDKITYHISTNNNTGHGVGSKIVGIQNKYLDFLMELGIRDKHSYDKFIPEQIFKLPKNSLSIFINRLFGDDGWCCCKNGSDEIGYGTTSERLARDIQHLLLRFGIQSSLSYRRTRGRGSWNISIKGKNNYQLFYDNIGFHIKRKQDNLINLLEISKDFFNQADILAVPDPTKYRIMRKDRSRPNGYSKKLRYYPTRDKANRITNRDKELEKFINADIFWVRIKEINKKEDQETYAISVDKYNTHLIDNLWSHNTLTLTDIILWILINNIYPGDYINYHVPGKAHAEPVFTSLVRQLRSNSFLKNFIDAKKGVNHSDLIIKLNNNTSLLCRIAGQTGTGVSVIGLHTPFSIVDEAGYYPMGTFVELQPTVNTFTSGFRLMVSGVPTGLREGNVLYSADRENSSYTKHRVSALQNPRFSEKDLQQAIEMYGGKESDDFIHLVLGEHGKPVFSLFDRNSMQITNNPVYKVTLDGIKLHDDLVGYLNALATFPGLPSKDDICIFGIDLGYTDPTAIVILYLDRLGRLKFHGRIRLNRVNYFVQEKIIDWLDTKFSPVIIGIDEGSAGKAVIPRLQEHTDFIHKNFKQRIIPINFSSQIVMGVDSMGNEIKNKTKPFSVSVLQDYTQNHKILYSSTDLEMVSELERMTYSRTISGDIVYTTLTERGGKKGEDHFTAALLCGVLAYYLQMEMLNFKPAVKKLAKPEWF